MKYKQVENVEKKPERLSKNVFFFFFAVPLAHIIIFY